MLVLKFSVSVVVLIRFLFVLIYLLLRHYIFADCNRKLFVTTDTELRAIAAPFALHNYPGEL